MVTQSITNLLNQNIKKDVKLVLLLDYDGTMAPVSIKPEGAVMAKETRAILEDIMRCENVYIAFISGRGIPDIKNMVGYDNLTYAGSHGFDIAFSDGTFYKHQVPEIECQRIQEIASTLKSEVARDGAWVENKGMALTFHYAETPIEKQEELITHCKKVVKSFGLEPTDAHNAVEVQPAVSWNKGYAGEYILKTKFGENWHEKVNVIYTGDDNSDEKLFDRIKGKATTFRIAASKNIKTAANLRIPSMQDVVTILKWVHETYKD